MSGHYSKRATAHPLDDEDVLWEILLRLPPHPSSLPRASAVCKRWCSILSDAGFARCFRKHHRKPPLLGFFSGGTRFKFSPVLDPPDRILPGRFTPLHTRKGWICTGCRHGLAVLVEESLRKAIVWDPLTGRRHCVAFPPGIEADDDVSRWHAAVLCVDAEDGHVHGDCFSSPFKLVLINNGGENTFACVYKSVSGVWGDIVSLASTPRIFFTRPSVLVGNALCWTLCRGGALVFDFESQSLCVMEKPADAHINHQTYGSVQLLRTEDNELGLATLSKFTIQLWERESKCDGVVRWVLLQKTIELEGLFPHSMQSGHERVLLIMGYDEDTNVIVLSTTVGNFLLQVESMQIRHITHTSKTCYDPLHPYTNFYTAVSSYTSNKNLILIRISALYRFSYVMIHKVLSNNADPDDLVFDTFVQFPQWQEEFGVTTHECAAVRSLYWLSSGHLFLRCKVEGSRVCKGNEIVYSMQIYLERLPDALRGSIRRRRHGHGLGLVAASAPEAAIRALQRHIHLLVSTKKEGIAATFTYDAEELSWKQLGNWVLPFAGRGHFDPLLNAFVGLSKDPDTLGQLYSSYLPSSGETPPVSKLGKEKLFSEDPAERHVGATLIYMGRRGKFCLVECVCIDQGLKEEGDVGCFLYRLTTFSLSHDMNGDLTTGKSRRVQYYKVRGKKGNFKKNGKQVATLGKKPKAGPKPETECFYCKGTGYWKQNCPKYLPDKKDGKVNKGATE
uniref:F-box domain-containing protein n=1 Tax=Aegilops tauschii TaxID=37682 RepID=M8B2J4_AEGTA